MMYVPSTTLNIIFAFPHTLVWVVEQTTAYSLYFPESLGGNYWGGKPCMGHFSQFFPLFKGLLARFCSTLHHVFLFSRLAKYQAFKSFSKRILVATDLFGRGMDIERVNIVFNYDMPENSDTYLHRVSSECIECKVVLYAK